MLNNKYSVLMSVYHGENPEYFKQSIESMINQTLPPDQIVIVKDGELKNRLEEVIEHFTNKKPELFTIVSLRENVGLGAALNKGLKKCRNELVARMDTDDISLEDRCEKQVKEFLRNEKLSIVGTVIDEFIDDPNKIVSSRVVPNEHNDIVKFSRRRNPFNHPTIMYKKSEVLNFGGYRNFRRNQDFDLFVRMINNGFIGKNISEALVLFRADEGNLKRRKSWRKCKNNIDLMYMFWKNGYTGFFDFLIVAMSQIIVLISPMWLFDWLNNRFLRKTVDNKRVVS